MNNVLHLIPHLGGGVGRFYQRIQPFYKNSDHIFVLLNEPEDKRFLPNNRWYMIDEVDLYALFENSDIVQIDFWNHPSLYALMQKLNDWPPLRLIAYSHVNGLYPPAHIPSELAKSLDLLVFSTKASLYTKVAAEYPGKIAVVPEFGGAEEFLSLKKTKHADFNVLYIGTADTTKFLLESVLWNIELARRNNEYKFIYCTQDQNTHLSEIIPTELKDNFEFHYAVSDISSYLAKADIFSYPLQQKHYGTGEQVLLEAMAAGLVPLVMNNLPERQIINDGVTGIIVDSKTEYQSAIEFLSKNKKLLAVLSANARNDIACDKSALNTAYQFDELYSKTCLTGGSKHFTNLNELSSHELFCLSQGDDGKFFRKSGFDSQYLCWKLKQMPQINTRSKGGLSQWANYFPNSSELSELNKLFSV